MNELTNTNAYEKALIQGDLSSLTPDQRLNYYKSVCESVKLNPLTKPFEYITLNGKLTLYAKRDATDQLRKINKVSIKITDVKTVNDVYIVIAEAKDADGRDDSSTGAVNIKGLTGDALANALMKAETKAKRRVTLSICGLGLLDESEVDSIKDAKPFVETKATQIESSKTEKQESQTKGLQLTGMYMIQNGKHKGKFLKDMALDDIEKLIYGIKEYADKQGQPPYGTVKDDLTACTTYLNEQAELMEIK